MTFEPALPELLALIAAVLPQLTRLIIVDNGSTGFQAQATPPIRELSRDWSGTLEFVFNNANLGIGAAQNQGIKHGIGLGHSHFLLLDQDSTPAPDMVMRLLEGLSAYQGTATVVAAGPRIEELKFAKPSYFVRVGPIRYQRHVVQDGDEPLRADLLIASGCLIKTISLQTVGEMDETFFVDRVDTEWCLRALAAGKVCIGVPSARLTHSIGHRALRIPVLGREVVLHSPLRHYYAFRNSILLMKRPYVSWQWRCNETILLAQMLVVYLAFGPDRVDRLRMIVKGALHGLVGRSGAFLP